ncbi:MAG: hypothetical protein ACLPKI_21495 [Streptosporangiaceae bacterium]
MRSTRAHRRHEAHLLADLERALRPGRRATIAGYAWWWRYEIGIALGLAAGMYLLARAVGPGPALLGVAVTAAVFGSWPASQRAFAASAWRIITPHRLRAGCVQARIHSRNGRLPTILRTTGEPFGERVLAWCPAGVSAADFRSARRTLAAACWAADVTVTADERHAHLVTIDVIRHRPGPLPGPGAPILPNATAWPDSPAAGSPTGRPDEAGRPEPGIAAG